MYMESKETQLIPAMNLDIEDQANSLLRRHFSVDSHITSQGHLHITFAFTAARYKVHEKYHVLIRQEDRFNDKYVASVINYAVDKLIGAVVKSKV